MLWLPVRQVSIGHVFGRPASMRELGGKKGAARGTRGMPQEAGGGMQGQGQVRELWRQKQRGTGQAPRNLGTGGGARWKHKEAWGGKQWREEARWEGAWSYKGRHGGLCSWGCSGVREARACSWGGALTARWPTPRCGLVWLAIGPHPSPRRHLHPQPVGAIKVEGDVVGRGDELGGGVQGREAAALEQRGNHQRHRHLRQRRDACQQHAACMSAGDRSTCVPITNRTAG